MKILIKNIGLMQDGKVTEHKNIAVEDKYIKEFPENPKEEEYDEIIEGHDMLAMGYDQVKFLKPVFFGDTITATYWITEVNEARRKTTGQCVMTNQRGETVLTCLHYMKVIDPVEEGKGP